MASSLSVLTRNRDFRTLFAAELVVFGADWFVLVPLLVLLPELTGSGVWGALVLAADTGIVALLLPYAGTIADRFDRKQDHDRVEPRRARRRARCCSSCAVARHAPGSRWSAVGAVAVAKAFYSPAASAALPNVVDPEDLAAANAVAGSAWGTMPVVGASLGGVLSAAFGPYACFWIASAAWPWPALPGVADPPAAAGAAGEPTRTPHAFAAIREALRLHRRAGRGAVAGHGQVGGRARQRRAHRRSRCSPALFGVGAVGAGLLFAVRGLGALIGPLLMRPVLTRRSWLLPGLAISMSRLRPRLPRGRRSRPGSRWCWRWSSSRTSPAARNWVMSNYALQVEVPDRLRGRVFATDMMLATLAISVSQLAVAARSWTRSTSAGRRSAHPGRHRWHAALRDRLADRDPTPLFAGGRACARGYRSDITSIAGRIVDGAAGVPDIRVRHGGGPAGARRRWRSCWRVTLPGRHGDRHRGRRRLRSSSPSLASGFVVVNPNDAQVIQFFGRYVGTRRATPASTGPCR